MNKGKFASLMMLGALSVGVASSSAVSAQGNESLASVTDVNGIGSYDNSLAVDFNVSDELGDADETEINTEVATDEDFSTDDISNLKVDTENVDESTENKKDLPEDLNRENNENKDYLYVDKDKKSEKNRAKKIMDSAVAVGGGTTVASMLVKSFITGSSDFKSVGDTELTYCPNTESDDISTELAAVYKSSDTESTYSPDSKSDDTSTKLDTDSKSSDTEPNYSPGSEYDNTNTEPDSNPKPNNLNKNKKNNNLKKSSIGIGAFAAILLVYLFICSNFENKLKDKVIIATRGKVDGDLLFNNVHFKEGELENKIINVMNKIFEKLCRNNIFALHKFKKDINLVSSIFAFYSESIVNLDDSKINNFAHFICGLEEKGLLNLNFIIRYSEYESDKDYRTKCKLLFNNIMNSDKISSWAKFINNLSSIYHQLNGFVVFVSSLTQEEIPKFVDFINSFEKDGFDVFAEILSYFGRIYYKNGENKEIISNFVKDIVTRKGMAGIINKLDKNKVRCLTRTHDYYFKDIVNSLSEKGAKNYLNVIFKLNSTGMDALKKVIDQLNNSRRVQSLVSFINGLNEVRVDEFAKYINGLQQEEFDKFVSILDSSNDFAKELISRINNNNNNNERGKQTKFSEVISDFIQN